MYKQILKPPKFLNIKAAPALLLALVLQDGGEGAQVHRLAQPKVGQLHVAPRIQQQVVRLYVPAPHAS